MTTHPNRIELRPGARPGPGTRLAGEVAAAGTSRRQFLGLSLLAAAGAAASPAFAAVGGAGGVGAVGAAGAMGERSGWRGQPGQSPALQWTELRDGVWVAIGGGGNSMLAIAAGEAALVDTKLATLGATLYREATSRAPGLAMVINTHHHADHSGGNFAFEAPRLIAHEKAAPRIRRQTDRYIEQLRSLAPGREGDGNIRSDLEQVRARLDELDDSDWAPRETMTGDRAEWMLGEDMKIEGRHFGAGHTDNDIAILLPGQNVMHAGDLLFHRMHPYFDPDGGGSCEGWIRSVKGAIELCDDETIVIPGHGEVTDREGLKGQLRYLEKLWEEVGELVDDGWTRDRAITMQWPFMDDLGRPELRTRAIGAVFDERSGR